MRLLMSSDNPNIINSVTTYLYYAFQKRNSTLNTIIVLFVWLNCMYVSIEHRSQICQLYICMYICFCNEPVAFIAK